VLLCGVPFRHTPGCIKVETSGLLAAEPTIFIDAGACEAAVDSARAFFDRLTAICEQEVAKRIADAAAAIAEGERRDAGDLRVGVYRLQAASTCLMSVSPRTAFSTPS
jgi:hypothetical protein